VIVLLLEDSWQISLVVGYHANIIALTFCRMQGLLCIEEREAKNDVKPTLLSYAKTMS